MVLLLLVWLLGYFLSEFQSVWSINLSPLSGSIPLSGSVLFSKLRKAAFRFGAFCKALSQAFFLVVLLL